jgi:hypothetical protein
MEIMGSGRNYGSSVNAANRGGRGGSGRGRGNFGRGRGQGGGRRRNTGGFTNNSNQRNGAGRGNQGRGGSNNSKLVCQVCLKTGHTADRCWHRFEEDYVPEEKHAGATMNSYTVDNN